MTPPDGSGGLAVIDKPAGWTSHDVVARMRRIAGTRKVGHAGTLDPMATGVLVLGIGRATKLLGLLALTDKTYEATIRLGQSTVTDDAEGDVVESLGAGCADEEIRARVADLTGSIMQRPSAVSAIKVDGKRSYARVRAGEDVELPARPVEVSRFQVRGIRRVDTDGVQVIDIDAEVDCSTGTYVRALARDLGEALGTGGHLTSLRRTRVGSFGLGEAQTLAEAEAGLALIPLDQAVAQAFPRISVAGDDVRRVLTGQRISVEAGVLGTVGVFTEDGAVLALAENDGGPLRYLTVFS